MTYEERVHNFGLRWLLENPGTGAVRLEELDFDRKIELYDETSGAGCSCDYDYDTEYGLVVHRLDGHPWRVELSGMDFADILKGVIAEGDLEPPRIEDADQIIREQQAVQIVDLKAKLKEMTNREAELRGQFSTLKNGMAQQTALWTFLRNLYKDLKEYTDGSTGLRQAEMEQLCSFLFKELDLWFNSNIGVETNKATFNVYTSRAAR